MALLLALVALLLAACGAPAPGTGAPDEDADFGTDALSPEASVPDGSPPADRFPPADRPFRDGVGFDAPLPGDRPDTTRMDVPVDLPPTTPTAILEVHLLDLWAQALPEADRVFELRRDGALVPTLRRDAAVRRLDLRDAAVYELTLSAPDHRTLQATVIFDGTEGAGGVVVRPAAGTTGQGVSLARSTRMVDGRRVPVHALFLGLRHLWFSAQGRPARRGNALRLLMDGEETWRQVHGDLVRARQSVHVSTWWWESEFELVRELPSHTTLSESERRRNTVLSLLEASPARKRVLVGQFLEMDGTASTITSDAPLRAHGTTRGDNFEYMGQANPARGMFLFDIPRFRFGERVRAERPEAASARFDSESALASEIPSRMIDLTHWPAMVDVLHASYHQKFLVVDDQVAFIGGMNFRRVDWDSSEHRVFDPRRMLFSASTANRQAVAARTRLPDTGPRKDYMLRIEGPIVRDAQEVFQRRWQYLLDTRARYSDDATAFSLAPPPAPVEGGVQAQVTATLPLPFHEYAIAETWFNAVAQARQYIYIEDQYFRIPMLVDAIERRMSAVPSLRLVVITKPLSEWTDPGCAWTRRTHERLLARFPDRYVMYQLRAFDTQVTWGIDETEARFQNMDVHSKLFIVDDVFLSVGSCNKNNRGIVYEGELNVAVLDPTWVRAARRRVLANILAPGTALSDDPAAWWTTLVEAASFNDRVRERWRAEGDDISLDGRPLPDAYRPRGMIYSLPMGTVMRCLVEDIGPDMV